MIKIINEVDFSRFSDEEQLGSYWEEDVDDDFPTFVFVSKMTGQENPQEGVDYEVVEDEGLVVLLPDEEEYFVYEEIGAFIYTFDYARDYYEFDDINEFKKSKNKEIQQIALNDDLDEDEKYGEICNIIEALIFDTQNGENREAIIKMIHEDWESIWKKYFDR